MIFATLGEFAVFMLGLAPRERFLDELGREEVAKLFVDGIQKHIGGEPSGPPSPFSWAPLAQQTVDRKGHSRPLFDTGKLHDSIGWGHESPRKSVVGSTDEKAVWHEFGPTNDRFPKRSFLAGTANEKNEEAFALYVGTIKYLSRFATVGGSTRIK